MALLERFLRAGEGKALKEFTAIAEQINAVEPEYQALSDADLRGKTAEFRTQLDNGAELDDLLIPAYATVREVAVRVLGQRHYDVQMVGGIALHRGMVAEMKTGEGKTLVSTLPAYLNALTGRGVHMITVNDYLASRDAEWMGELHGFLGLTIGLITNGQAPSERKPQYNADITYGTNNEFGFDYLRDNMAMRVEDMVQRGHVYAVVDEVDSILIDEARTPLIISGRVADNAKWYKEFARIVERLRSGEHYEVDERKRQVLITEEGVARVEEIVGVENLYDHAAVDLVHHLESALKAKELFHKDVEYLLTDGEVKIVDEFTGRVLEGRRYSEGLHQAIEAKEGVAIKQENQTLATITLQNYFRLYEKLSGMTGTAETEATELANIYNLQVMVIPTNRPIARIDQPDLVYKTEKAKFEALADLVAERHANGQPVLLGTVSIDKSERLSEIFTKRGVKHEILNAKAHAREAEIVAQAGRPGAVTVATNMAGRGVDIQLGGNPQGLARTEMKKRGLSEGDEGYDEAFAEEMKRFTDELAPAKKKAIEAGGLFVVGTERHESRRIDNQLRGRSGRQGDPGESRFFLSLDDELMRRFQGERVASIMERLNMPDDMPIEAGMVSKAVERAQSQVESQNFEIRKNVLKYDEVMNRQREVIYEWRAGILAGDLTRELVDDWIEFALADAVERSLGDGVSARDWDWELLSKEVSVFFEAEYTRSDFGESVTIDDVTERVVSDGRAAYDARETELGPEVLRQVERSVTLQMIDKKWREHLADMDYLRAGIGLRAMGQRDPLSEYQREGFGMFEELVDGVKYDTARYLFHVQLAQPEPAKPVPTQTASTNAAPASRQPIEVGEKVGRNEPCPCGSGKKYKRCHGAA